MEKTLYIVIPCYNEEAVLEEMTKRLTKKLKSMIKTKLITKDSKIMYVNDGSKDKTWNLIEKLNSENSFVTGVNLTKNRGHQNALLAGLMTAKEYADVVVSMDADLQDDIDVLDKYIKKYNEGYDIVYGVRSSRKKDTWFKKTTAKVFYRFMSILGVDIVYNHADYRLMSKRALEDLSKYKEVNLFLRGIIPLIGYKTATVEYERNERFAGESKYPLRKMINFAIEGILSFSIKPIRIITSTGFIVAFLSIIYLIYIVIGYFLGNNIQGWTTLAALISMFGGFQIFSIGIIGEYIGKIYLETKERPRYIIEKVLIDSNKENFKNENKISDIKEKNEYKKNQSNIENEQKRYIKLDKILCTTSILFLAIPVIMLLFFWFNLHVSIPCISMLATAIIFALKKIKPLEYDEYKKIFTKRKIIFVIIGILIINFMSGAGGIAYQNWDYGFRNVVIRDLVNKDWPVRYDYSEYEYETSVIGNKDAILSYYFAYWLPGAAIGKIFSSFRIASLFMLFYQIVGTILFFYLVMRKMKSIKRRYLLIFICFGGMDIITKIIVNKFLGGNISSIPTLHIDTVNSYFCMSTFITQLFWVFNQSIPAWIATMLMINDKNYKNIGLYVALLVPFSPFPVLGIVLCAMVFILFGYNFNNLINLNRIKECFSITNILSVISVIPTGLLLLQNTNNKGCMLIRAYQNGNLDNALKLYVLYILFEFLFYAIICTKNNYKKIIFIFICFAVLPLFYLGGGLDLGNRATIPLLILLYIEVLKFFNLEDSKYRIRKKILCLFLIITFITNLHEFRRSIEFTKYNYEHKITNFNDHYWTFENFEKKGLEPFIKNFISPFKKNKLFFKYLLKK